MNRKRSNRTGQALGLGLLGILGLGLALSGSPAAGWSGVEVRGYRVTVETAETPQELARGLQHRAALAPDRGMLFVLPGPDRAGFWMKDTLIPLDILWLDADAVVIHIAADCQPCQADPCPIWRPRGNASFVLELPAGRAAELGVRLGDRLRLIE